jgi:3-deoxy-D-manno-octulosonic-acid transferase
MDVPALAYRLIQHLAMAVTPVAARGSSKLAKGLAGRRSAHARLVAWGTGSRDATRPCVWMHAPSVGEGLQARAVLEALKERVPGLQSVYTHFSPSAEELARAMPSDAADYLPWDVPSRVRPVLDAVKPDLVVFTKTEVWPVLAEEATRRGTPVALVGGALPPGARRARPAARALLRPTWGRVSPLCAISEADADGFRGLGAPPDGVFVTGDPGIDSAARRAGAADPGASYLAPFARLPRPTLVAGSTWPADETVLVRALGRVRAGLADVRVIVAPHEPTPAHVQTLGDRLAETGWRCATLGEVEERRDASGVDAVVVDRVGVLAHLYTVGDVAYVGGGFHDAGLHSVLEPAAVGVPVLFGPRHRNARAASDLLECGGARQAADPEALAAAMADWLERREERDYAGGRALGYIQRHLGAADRSAALLAALLDPQRLSP